jgi:hypothetical protein
MTVLSGKMAGDSGAQATSTNVYDANGYMIGVTYSTAGDAPQTGTSNKVFIMDQNGVILLAREQSHNSPTAEQHEIVANGQLQLRFSTSYGSFNDLEDEQKDAFWKAYNVSATQSMVSANGELRVDAGASSTTGQSLIVASGDTLQSMAARIYGTPDAWYRIADANNLQKGSVLLPGSTLVAPAGGASTNGPEFDLGKLVGSTAPNLPPPPADSNNCIALVIVAVVVIVTVLVAPYMAQAASYMLGAAVESAGATVLAGAMTSAAANIAGQAVAIGLGVQDNISWGAVGMAAVGGAMGKAMNVGWINVGPDAWVNAAVANIMTQKIGVMTGMQEKFSWANVAGASIGAHVTQGMAEGAYGEGLQSDASDGFAARSVRGGLSGFAGNLTTELIVPGKQDWARVALGAADSALSGGMNEESHDSATSQTTTEATGPSEAPGQALSASISAEEAGNLADSVGKAPALQNRMPYIDGGTDYLDRLAMPELQLAEGWLGDIPRVHINQTKMTAAEIAAYDRGVASKVNPFTILAEVGKYALGGIEMGAKGIWNDGWRIAGSAIALPAALDSADAYLAVSKGITDRFHIENRSQGAREIGEAIRPYAQSAGAWLNEARDYSEKHVGLGATSLLFASGDAALQIVTVVGPGKVFGAFGRAEGVAAEAVRSRLVTLTEVANPAQQAAMRAIAVERGVTSAAGGEAGAVTALRAVEEAVRADASVSGQRGVVVEATRAVDDVSRANGTYPMPHAIEPPGPPAMLMLDTAGPSRIHPSRGAALSTTVLSKESILHELRQAGTPESLIAAKLISKGKLNVVIQEQMFNWVVDPKTGIKGLVADPFTRGAYNPYRPYEISIFTKNISSMREAAGVITHEVTHFRQYDRAAFNIDFQFHMGHEFEANRAQGRVDPGALGAPYNKGTGKNEGLTDWGLWYRLDSNRGYKNVARDPVKRGEFSLRNDWKQLFMGQFYRAFGD